MLSRKTQPSQHRHQRHRALQAVPKKLLGFSGGFTSKWGGNGEEGVIRKEGTDRLRTLQDEVNDEETVWESR